MVLKKTKTPNTIWMDTVERSTLEHFIEELHEDWPSNTAVTQIVMVALTDPEIRNRVKERLNSSEVAMSIESKKTLKCAWCGFRSRNLNGITAHIESGCKKRPLEVLVR